MYRMRCIYHRMCFLVLEVFVFIVVLKKKSYVNLVKIKAATIKCWRVHTFLALLISNGWLVHGNCGLRQCFNDSTAFTSKGLVWGEVHSHPIPHALRRTHTLMFVLRYHPTTIPCRDYYKGPLHTERMRIQAAILFSGSRSIFFS